MHQFGSWKLPSRNSKRDRKVSPTFSKGRTPELLRATCALPDWQVTVGRRSNTVYRIVVSGRATASLCIFLNLTSAANTKDCVVGQGAFSPCRAPCESFGVRIDASIPRPGLWRNPQNFLAPELAQDSYRTVLRSKSWRFSD